MRDLTLTNAQIVLPNEVINGSIHIKNGIITDVDQGGSTPAAAIDCERDFVIPGLVELHTDNLERHIQPRPKVGWPHAAAILAHDGELASVGITTVFDAMRVGSIPDQSAEYGKYARQLATELWELRDAGALRISHFLHLRAEVCSETLVEEMREFGVHDRVGIVSLMDHTPGQRQFRDLSKLKAYVQGKHNLSDPEFDVHVSRLKDLRNANGERHETEAVAAAQRYGAVLASHDDTTAAHVATSASHGIRLAEFPTTVEAAKSCREHGIAVMMGAPNLIRGGSHSGNVAAHELAELDLLDIVSSDYVPSALMSAAFLLADLWDDLPKAISTVTAAPAKAAGLTDRGQIRSGLRGDLVRISRVQGAPVVRGVWSQGQQIG
ncbi:alpha-D-ribose 1-methylphosphonate 5-triphosphate diphosphatase [Cochlodiniinecator piscidefendens]|uniref:alpha-D-ribose 1-methylphosphonate 5-triphosphate diphosphatase n=1 Tax=Cochlodiniinecator piscidefendens TaxID=2715756 RepID=UPI00140DCECE|nr:alpha-D-ribose 1-methylphosphonate 5-triphosphate diphosphatase [Cochlodiniinecator piscidefendens]